MPVAINSVVDEALSLPAEIRISLVEKILVSLNLPTRTEIDKLWAEEAERRVAEIDSGNVELRPGEEVFSRIRKRYA